jgi:anti-sigma regulatory factor (Ser/Thr protein kinase)
MNAPRRNPVKFEIRQTVPAGLRHVDVISVELRRELQDTCTGSDLFAAELLLREALTNAALHGCGLDPAGQVCFWVRVRKNRLLIAVSDTGPGFDWKLRLNHGAKDHETSGRGLSIYRAYANRIRFSKKGNAVTLVRDLPGGNRFVESG